MNINDIITKLHLMPHPEGGYYRETYRDNNNASTAIYFLITENNFSAFHKIKQDELFHFYYGDPVKLVRIDDENKYTTKILGNDFTKNNQPQIIVPANKWQALKIDKINQGYALLGTTVAPAFEFSGFTMGNRADLLKEFPKHAGLITEFTRN